jgi:hypothetical protein
MARSPAKTAAADVSAAPAPAARQQDPAHFAPRDGRAVVIGRDGKPIYRGVAPGQASGTTDVYNIAAKYQPPGYVYEWKRYATLNAPDYSYHAEVQRVGGWAPVQNERHPGVWLPPDHKGAIIINGLMLMERPIELHREALREEKNAADEKVRHAKTSRGLQAASNGVDTNTPEARAASFVKEGRLRDGNIGKDGMSDADAIAEARPTYNYDRSSID